MVDAKCNFPNGKYKKAESSTCNLDTYNEDESLLRQPLRTSYTGFWEAKKAYENGTDEVRRLLMQECSLIYECSVCRNMFRSLPNFISHKRKYCKTKRSDNFYSFQDPNSSMLIQTVERPEAWLLKSRSTGSSPVPSNKSSNRDLSKVIERLKRVEVSSESGNNNLGMENKMITFSPEPKAPDPVLELERVSTTSHAVYQTLKTQNDTDSIKTELDEVHNLLTNQQILLGPDGKASPLISITSSTANNERELAKNNCKATPSFQGISCEICKIVFQTEKTLKMHVQKKHTSTTYVFQCPTCSMTFLQPAAVIRHLANDHKKPLRRIRKLRDTILKKRIQIGDVQVKGPSREVKRLKMDNTKDFNMLDQQNCRSVTSCTYCLKNFERRAVLATHLSNCLARKLSLNNSEVSKKMIDLNEQIKKTKLCNQISNQLFDSKNQHDERNDEKETDVKVDIKIEPQDNHSSASNSSNINELFQNLENQTFGNGLQTVCLEKLQMMVELTEHGSEDDKDSKDEVDKEHDCCNEPKNPTEKDSLAKKEKTKCFRKVSATKQLTCRCKICNKQFNALSNLRRHISMFHYRSRRFGCNLCDYRAFRRYDIVNHLTFVHKMTGERESMAIEYVTVHELKYSKDDVEGDIVVINDEAVTEQINTEEKDMQVDGKSQILAHKISLKTYEKREKRKKVILQSNTDVIKQLKKDPVATKEISHVKVVRRKMKRSLDQQVEGKKRPIRNRIKTVNKDFVYDLFTIKEESKQLPRLTVKRSNSIFVDQSSLKKAELPPPPIKISPYRLRTEPLMPFDKGSVKGAATSVYRNVINEALAAPSTLPELPTKRPQMRSRLISSSRSDSNTVPIIETTELEAARLKSTFFDDSFLEKFAKKSNPSFKMKPLWALQHSPLNSILQKFDASQQNNILKTESLILQKPPERENHSPPNYNKCSLQIPTQTTLKEKDVTPNGKQLLEPSSPPAAPKKRITLMQRLAENRAKRRDSLVLTTLEN